MTDLGLTHRRSTGGVQRVRPYGIPPLRGRNMRIKWKLPPGVTLRDVLDKQEALEHACNGELVCSMDRGKLVMDIYRHEIPAVVDFGTFYALSRPPGRLLIGLGNGRRGALWVDLASLPHLLIGGMTGGGKSVFLLQALTHLALDYTPQQLQLVCIDLKGGIELSGFGQLPHAQCEVVDDIEDVATVLASVRTELDRRLKNLRHARLRDSGAWNDSGYPAWPSIVVVIDELAELTVRDVGNNAAARDAQKAAVGRLCEIARLGRAAGIHLIVCTQRPDAEAVPGQLKANLAGTVAFRVRAAVNSVILLECDRAALLPQHPGRAIWARERVEEFQAIYISREDTDRLLTARWHVEATAERVTPRVQNTDWNTQTPIYTGISSTQMSSGSLDTGAPR